jgi:hypothetical protein
VEQKEKVLYPQLYYDIDFDAIENAVREVKI